MFNAEKSLQFNGRRSHGGTTEAVWEILVLNFIIKRMQQELYHYYFLKYYFSFISYTDVKSSTPLDSAHIP